MKKITILFCAITVLVLSSCNGKDFLSYQPSTSVSDEQAFSSVESATTVLNSAYAFIGNYQNHTIGYIAADVMGEDCTITSGAYGWPTYNWNQFSYMYAQTPVSNPWWSGYSNYVWPVTYKALDDCNSIIKFIAPLPEGSAKEDLLAQAHGVRGFAYLYLVRLFCESYNSNPSGKGVVLRLEPADANSEHIGRSTVKEAYELIIKDLKYAYDHVKNVDSYRITKKGAALLLARTYLDMNDFKNAELYANEAASNIFDGSNLMSKEEWKSGFKDRNNEWLWAFQFIPSNCNIYASIPSFYYFASGMKGVEYGGKIDPKDAFDLGENIWDGYGTVRWTKNFVTMFESKDVRKMFPFYCFEEDGFFTSKFSHRTMMGDAEFPMARIAEAYLIKAECLMNNGKSAESKTILNALQIKRGATATDGSLENIYKERRKELYGEGFRLHDIKRLRQPLVRSKYAEHWIKLDLPADSPRFMFPIPEKEMLYNKALKADDQNTYWK